MEKTNVVLVIALFACGMVTLFAAAFAIRALMDHVKKAYEIEEDAMEGYVL